jgi:flagella basal body P-ring formation protein FlgA
LKKTSKARYSLAFIGLVPAIMTGCANIKPESIAGYHKNWTGNVLRAAKNIEQGQKLTGDAVELQPATRAGSPIDALCFPKEADGTTAKYPIPAGTTITFHALQGAKIVQQVPTTGAGEKPGVAADANAPQIKIVIAHRRIAKGSTLFAEWLDEVEVPKAEQPIDAFNSVNALVGQTANYDIAPSEVISQHAVSLGPTPRIL